MKILKNKFLVRLITVICLFFVLFNFVGTTKVYAESEGWGGVLIKPVVKLLTAIADGIIGALNRNIEGQSTAFIKIEGESNWWNKWGAKVIGIITGVIITAAIVASIIGTAGAAALGVGTTIKIAVALLLSTGTAGYLIADVMDGSYFPEDIYLPVFRVSLDRIFSDDIALLDVNFFEPNKYTRTETTEIEDVTYSQKTIFTDTSNTYRGNQPDWINLYFVTSSISDRDINDATNLYFTSEAELNSIDWNNYSGGTYDLYDFKENSAMQDVLNEINKKQQEDSLDIIDASNSSIYTVMGKSYKKDSYDATGNMTESKIYNILKIKDNVTGQFKFTIKYNFSTLDGNYLPAEITIIREAGNFTGVRYEENVVEVISTAAQLQGVVSTWYFILRNVALLVLMLLLIYSGIRIVIGSTAGEKAKYKERLMDWLVAVCLIFVMHYIMVFAVELVAKITDLVGVATGGYERGAIIKLTDTQYEDIKNKKTEIASQVDSTNGNKDLYWNTDLMGEIKLYSQQEKEGTENWVGMAIAYVVLVLYTVFFIWTYLKRVLYMSFLTMMSPLVAMTYPIDKINDGKAQAFNMWFKEYIFNLLIQPMHLLLYSVLVTSAYELAATSTIYTLVAIGFMIPAEKLVRKFFGFEKAQTPGLLGGAAGAALAMTGIQNMLRHHPKGKSPERYKDKEESNNNVKQFSSKEGVDIFGTLANRGENFRREDAIEFGTKGGDGDNRELEDQPEVRENARTESESEFRDEARTEAKPEGISSEEGRAIDEREGSKKGEKDGTRMERIKTGLGKVGRTISGVSGSYARQLGNKVLKRIQNGRPIRTMLKGATGLAGGALLGLTGAALGIASGDPNKVLQYTSAGALAGYGAGSGVANSVVDTFSVNTKELEEEAEMSYHGEEYASKKFKEQLEKDLKSKKNIERIRTLTGWSRDEAIEFLDTTGKECYSSGVTEVDDMLAIKSITEKEDKDKRIPTMKEAILATKLKNQLPQKIGDMTTKKRQDYEDTYIERFKQELRKLHTDWSEEQINNQAKENTRILIRDMKNLDSAKSELTQV